MFACVDSCLGHWCTVNILLVCMYTLIMTFRSNPICTLSVQELLLKDLPDPLSSQARRYSRRPSLNEPPIPNAKCTREVVNVTQRTAGASWSRIRGCPNENGANYRPKVVVEGLTAAWEKGEVSML